MRYWNCQIKHTVGEVSKQLFFAKKKFQTIFFPLEMIDMLFTDKSQAFLYFKSLAFFCVRCLLTGCSFFLSFFFTWSRPCGKSFFKDLVYTGKAATVRLQCSQVV